MELDCGYGYGWELWGVVFFMIPGNGEIDVLDGWAFLGHVQDCLPNPLFFFPVLKAIFQTSSSWKDLRGTVCCFYLCFVGAEQQHFAT
jgi:hypothetical protein